MSLADERNLIDQIDTQMMELFLRRMESVERIAAIKQERGETIYRPEREKEILERLTAMSPQRFAPYAKAFCQSMMELSKDRQLQKIAELKKDDFFSSFLSAARCEYPQPRVTVQGVEGSFAMAAAVSMYPEGRISYTETWEDVLCAVEDGNCDYGVLPVENSSAGSVGEVYDLLIRHKNYIVKAVSLRVDQCLLGVPGADLSQIRKVYSHPHALPQCRDFLKSHPQMQAFTSANTAVAAEFVAKQADPSFAAIASRECAELYGLNILADSIQQNHSNCTRFFSVSKCPEISEDANKISLLFTLPHVTGSLYHTLARFAHSDMNLTKIESRPDPERNFEYQFFLDFTGNIHSPSTLALLSSLEAELPTFYFLGNYCET